MRSDLGCRTSLGLSSGSALAVRGVLSTGSSASLRTMAQPAFTRHRSTMSPNRIRDPTKQAAPKPGSSHDLTGDRTAPASAQRDGMDVRHVTTRREVADLFVGRAEAYAGCATRHP